MCNATVCNSVSFPSHSLSLWGVQVYEQLSASRNRLSQQLSEKNRAIAAMEERLEQRERDLVTAMRSFSLLRTEVMQH